MRIAIPIFGPRVSPRFDCAPSLLLFRVENGKVVEQGEVSLSELAPWQRLGRVQELGIQIMICGGIDGYSARLLEAQQIQVFAWIAGEAEEAIKTFLRGELKSGLSLCPGCGGKRVRMRKGKI